jgi:hypothetical protein
VSDKRRIVMKGVINEQESRRRGYVAEIDEGLSSDDEFQEFEQGIIKKAIQSSEFLFCSLKIFKKIQKKNIVFYFNFN